MSYVDFSSWPREQEMSFVVYEQRATESLKKAKTIAAIVSLLVLVVAIGIYAGVEPNRKNELAGAHMSNLTKKTGDDSSTTAPAAAPTPAPAPAPAASPTPAPAPSGDTKADPAATAPAK